MEGDAVNAPAQPLAARNQSYQTVSERESAPYHLREDRTLEDREWLSIVHLLLSSLHPPNPSPARISPPAAARSAAFRASFTTRRNSRDALNAGTNRRGTDTGSSVCGLRAVRAARSRAWNEPNPRKLHGVACREGLADGDEEAVHDGLGFELGKPRPLGDAVYDVCLRHGGNGWAGMNTSGGDAALFGTSGKIGHALRLGIAPPAPPRLPSAPSRPPCSPPASRPCASPSCSPLFPLLPFARAPAGRAVAAGRRLRDGRPPPGRPPPAHRHPTAHTIPTTRPTRSGRSTTTSTSTPSSRRR